MSASGINSGWRGGVGRSKIRRVRPILEPLIGERAFHACVRAQRFARFLIFPFALGVGAVVASVFTRETVQPFLACVWGACVVYCLVGLPFLIFWVRRSSRLASRKLSDELGYPIRIRGVGGSLDVEVWRRQVDRALRRYRDRHPVPQREAGPG